MPPKNKKIIIRNKKTNRKINPYKVFKIKNNPESITKNQKLFPKS